MYRIAIIIFIIFIVSLLFSCHDDMNEIRNEDIRLSAIMDTLRVGDVFDINKIILKDTKKRFSIVESNYYNNYDKYRFTTIVIMRSDIYFKIDRKTKIVIYIKR